MTKNTNGILFPHPGETIREDYLKPLGMSINQLAIELRVPATRMLEVVRGRRGITADTALRLARYFNTTPKFWLNLQTSYDLAVTAEAKQEQIVRMVHPREAVSNHSRAGWDAAFAKMAQRGDDSLFDALVSRTRSRLNPKSTG